MARDLTLQYGFSFSGEFPEGALDCVRLSLHALSGVWPDVCCDGMFLREEA
ncbi:MAG TPA: hypothetical protein VKY85_04260 [Candidatus Angelobacter sp.]|nr:hypothetical protein [Candidatus Angelobacter sp.]